MVAAFRVLGSYLADGHLIGPAALLKDKVSSSKKTTTTTTIKNQDTKKIDSEPTTITTKSMRIGIVGFGRFGQFLAETFNRHVGVTVCACSRSDYSTLAAKMGVLFYRSTEDMLRSGVDVLIISVSILSFQKVMSYLPKDLLKVSNPLVCDVLSVKNHAKSTMKSILPEELDILCMVCFMLLLLLLLLYLFLTTFAHILTCKYKQVHIQCLDQTLHLQTETRGEVFRSFTKSFEPRIKIDVNDVFPYGKSRDVVWYP